MISHWLYRDQSPNLILFCNGWGMDHHPLSPLESGGYDVLVLSDYSAFELPIDLGVLTEDYQEINLICWSFGVWAGANLFAECQSVFSRRIGVNGTLRPIDDQFGIPHQLFDATLAHFSVSVRERFYQRMCRFDGVYDQFMQNQPRRRLEDQENELRVLAEMVARRIPEDPFYDAVIVASRDYIVATAHQFAFWKERCPIVRIESCHYPFAGWQSWAELAALRN